MSQLRAVVTQMSYTEEQQSVGLHLPRQMLLHVFSLGSNLLFLSPKSNAMCGQQHFAYTDVVCVACHAGITVFPSSECNWCTLAQKILSRLSMVQFCLNVDLST